MPMANEINAITTIQSDPSSESPSAVEAAGRTHRNLFILYVLWLLLSALITALFTWLVWRASNRQQEATTVAGNARAENLESQNLSLQTEVTNLQIEQGETHEHVQETRRKLDPRKFSEPARRGFLRKISETTGTIDILWIGDRRSEAFTFATDVARVVKQAGWTVVTVEELPLEEVRVLTADLSIKRSLEGIDLAVLFAGGAPFENRRAAAFLHEGLRHGGYFAPMCMTEMRAGKSPLLLVGPKRLRS